MEKDLKMRFIVILLALMLILIAVVGYWFINEKKVEKKSDQVREYQVYDVCSYEDIKVEDGNVYVNDKKIYACNDKKNCLSVYEGAFFYCNKTDKIITIADGDSRILYDYGNEEILLEADNIYSTIYQDDSYEKYAYLVYRKNGLEGLVSIYGDIITEPIYENIGLYNPVYFGEYSISNGTIAARKDGKVGVIALKDGKEVISFLYDDVRIYDDYYILVSDDEISLVDLHQKQLLKGEFDNMVILEGYLFVEQNNQLYIYDTNGNKLLDDSIAIYNSFENNLENGYVVDSDSENLIITVFEYTNNEVNSYCYTFDTLNNKISEATCTN